MLLLAARQEAYPYPPLAECPGRYWKKHFPVQVRTERRTSLAQDFSWLCVCWALYFPLLLFSSIFQVWVLINNVYFNSFQDPTYSLHIQPYWVRLENMLLLLLDTLHESPGTYKEIIWKYSTRPSHYIWTSCCLETQLTSYTNTVHDPHTKSQRHLHWFVTQFYLFNFKFYLF